LCACGAGSLVRRWPGRPPSLGLKRHVIGVPVVVTAALLAASAPASYEREFIHDDDYAASLLARLSLPTLLKQTSRYSDLSPSCEVLRCDLSGFPPKGEVDPVHLVPVAAPGHGE